MMRAEEEAGHKHRVASYNEKILKSENRHAREMQSLKDAHANNMHLWRRRRDAALIQLRHRCVAAIVIGSPRLLVSIIGAVPIFVCAAAVTGYQLTLLKLLGVPGPVSELSPSAGIGIVCTVCTVQLHVQPGARGFNGVRFHCARNSHRLS